MWIRETPEFQSRWNPGVFCYHSAKLEVATANDIDLLLNKLGIRTEIDLRPASASSESERAKTHADLLNSGRWTYIQSAAGTSAKQYGDFINNPTVAAEYLRVFADPANYPIIFHCAGGADRTGSLAFILNALQGVSLEDLIKEYEFTHLRYLQGSSNVNVRGFLMAFDALEGDTSYEKARTFCLSAGLTDAEIDAIILNMRGQ